MIAILNNAPRNSCTLRYRSVLSPGFHRSLELSLPNLCALGYSVAPSGWPTFLAGRLDLNQRQVESMVLHRPTPRLLLGLHSTTLQTRLAMRVNGMSWNGILGYSSHGQLWGLQLLRRVGAVSIGSELLYSHADRTGGLTVGGRVAMAGGSLASLTLNPLMGHLQANLFLPVFSPADAGGGRRVQAAGRYDFNVHSLHSNFSLGVSLRHYESLVILSASANGGLGVQLEGRLLPQLVTRLGVQLGGQGSSSSLSLCLFTEA